VIKQKEVKLVSRTKVDEEPTAAATLSNLDEVFDAAIALVATKTHVEVELTQEERCEQVDRREVPNRGGCQDKTEYCV
jgi:hypothetical protein